MPITAITYQPIEDSLNSAYRPIIFRCRAKVPNATAQNYKCPIVFADIYIDGVYYKSLSRTQFIKDENEQPEYEFDIQDAIQELMDYNLPKINGTTIENLDKTIKKVFVKFRNAFTDANGFSISEQVEPVQGTSSNDPITGGGIITNNIYVLNSVVQHEENQNLDELLDSYKTREWKNSFPLTKRPAEFKICRNDSSHFPIISSIKPTKICIEVKLKTGEIVEDCAGILESCPKLENITYTATPDYQNGVVVIVFNWVNPSNLPPVPYELKIYRRIHGTNNPWSTTQFTAFPNPITSQTVILPLGYYDFVFEIVGSCKDLDFSELPVISNVGAAQNNNDNDPEVVIKWKDNNGNEPRTCTQSVCNFAIVVDASDPDNDIVNVQILKSTNNGITWNVFISHLLTNSFDDYINTTGKQLYKAVVTDSNNNEATSNILSYSKQQQLNPIYRKAITGITCTSYGNSPTNYDVWCTGSNDFTLSDSNLLNLNTGFIRLSIDASTNEIGLSKSGAGSLVLNEAIPITTVLTASYSAVGQNPPSAYPWGYTGNVPAAIYTFEYSLDGLTGWTSFQLTVDD